MIEIQNKRLKDFNDALFNWFLKNYLFNTENRNLKDKIQNLIIYKFFPLHVNNCFELLSSKYFYETFVWHDNSGNWKGRKFY